MRLFVAPIGDRPSVHIGMHPATLDTLTFVERVLSPNATREKG